MYWELRKKMPEIIKKATREAVAEALAEARQQERARFKRFCEKHGITYSEEDWEDETLESEDE